MLDLKHLIGSNISGLRKHNGITQMDLAQRLNYSDKAVSKWERGESIPDITVLKQIAELFNVSLDYFVEEVHRSEEQEHMELLKARKNNRRVIVLLSTACVWLLATVVFIILEFLPADAGRFMWLIYAYAIPLSCIVFLFFSVLWKKKKYITIVLSVLIWSLLICVYLSFPHEKFRYLFLIGIPAQVIVILTGRFKNIKNIKKQVDDKYEYKNQIDRRRNKI